MIEGILGFLIGVISLLGYILYRMMKNPGWDDSNITNALRLLSHVTLHAEDFGEMWYVDSDLHAHKQPFWYLDKDELSEVVRTRP